jgi:hypothetical protein
MSRKNRNHSKPTATLTLQHFNPELGKWVSSSPITCYGDEDEELSILEAYAVSYKAGLKTRIQHERMV